MSDGREPGTPGGGPWSAANLLTPPACAIAALALAMVAMLGQNVVTVGVSTLLESPFNGSTRSYVLGYGLAAAVQAVVVLLLARRALGEPGWAGWVSRAAVIVAAVTVVGAAVTVLGGLARGY